MLIDQFVSLVKDTDALTTEWLDNSLDLNHIISFLSTSHLHSLMFVLVLIQTGHISTLLIVLEQIDCLNSNLWSAYIWELVETAPHFSKDKMPMFGVTISWCCSKRCHFWLVASVILLTCANAPMNFPTFWRGGSTANQLRLLYKTICNYMYIYMGHYGPWMYPFLLVSIFCLLSPRRSRISAG